MRDILRFSTRMLLFILPFGVIGVFAFKALFMDEAYTYQVLYRYQLRKLEAESTFETIIVGDSSAGNAIDADYFSELTGTETLNLSLNGLYGYAGSYNMILKALKASPNLKNVIVVQTADMMQRPISYQGYLYSAASFGDVWAEGLNETLVSAFFDSILSRIGTNAILADADKQTRPVVNDYAMQEGDFTLPRNAKEFDVASINEGKLFYLLKIQELCRERGLNLVYMNGPLWEPVILASTDYLDEVERLITAQGIVMIDEVLPIQNEELGDSIDHVQPDAKQSFTEQYAQALLPYLQLESR